MALQTHPEGALRRALVLPDLTDPLHGHHALQLLVAQGLDALRALLGCPVLAQRGSPVVSTADNWEVLRYPPAAAARDERYTRRVDGARVLRSHTSAMVPQALRLAAETGLDDVLVACPGLVYRRDVIDRLHTGEPHQLDLWRLAARPLGRRDLEALVRAGVGAALPAAPLRLQPALHPYTVDGLELEARAGRRWVEVGECGLAHPEVLRACGHDPARVS